MSYKTFNELGFKVGDTVICTGFNEKFKRTGYCASTVEDYTNTYGYNHVSKNWMPVTLVDRYGYPSLISSYGDHSTGDFGNWELYKKPKYKAGEFIIHISSYENDGDFKNTVQVVSPDITHAQAVVAFCNIFEGDLGNLYSPSKEEEKAVAKAFIAFANKYPVFFGSDQPTDEEETVNYCMDTAYDMGLSCGEQYTRALYDIKVERVMQNVYMDNVTGLFQK